MIQDNSYLIMKVVKAMIVGDKILSENSCNLEVSHSDRESVIENNFVDGDISHKSNDFME